MDFWLCDLEKALTKIRENYGHLGIVATSVFPAWDGIVFKFTSGNTVKWFRLEDKIETIKDWEKNL